MRAFLSRCVAMLAITACGAVLMVVNGSVTSAAAATPVGCNHSVKVGQFRCFALRAGQQFVADSAGTKALVVSHSGYGPGDLASAYSLPVTTTTATVAVVDAYDDPNAEADLAVYRSYYGLPACTTANGCFRKVNQEGLTSPLPAPDQGWSGEIALDLAMVSATCPSCHILLVEADRASSDLYLAVQRAVSMGVKYVSMSWGSSESPDERGIDAQTFGTPGVVYTAASGDSAYGVNYPASSARVIAVGGTSLRPAANARGWTESTWLTSSQQGTGSGCSGSIPKPSWQAFIPSSTCAYRSVADVSAVSDPATGVAVYQSYGSNGWAVYGGTSAAAPIIAGISALAGTPGAADVTAQYPYLHPSALNDVTTGSNGACSAALLCHAGAGWDGPTGLGSPNGVADFTASNQPTPTRTTAAVCHGQLLSNGNFQNAKFGWAASPAVIRRTGLAYTGHTAAVLGLNRSAATQILSRRVSIPAGCTAVLTYKLRVVSSDPSRAVHDRLTLSVNGHATQIFSNLNRGGFVTRSTRLTKYSGTKTLLEWTERGDGTGRTTFTIDDVAITLSP